MQIKINQTYTNNFKALRKNWNETPNIKIPWKFRLEYFEIDKSWKENHGAKFCTRKKFGSYKTSSKRFRDRELGNKCSDTKFWNNKKPKK